MNPTSNQMNSMYQSPLGAQPKHKTSVLSIVVLLLIAGIIAVLGFGRINNMKEEEMKMMQQQADQARMMQEQNQATDNSAAAEDDASADVLVELEAMDADTNDADIRTMESAF